MQSLAAQVMTRHFATKHINANKELTLFNLLLCWQMSSGGSVGATDVLCSCQQSSNFSFLNGLQELFTKDLLRSEIFGN
jgi:hypothetical protein